MFCDRGPAGGSVTLVSVFGVLAAIFVVLFSYCRGVLGWSGLRSTVALLPMAPKVAKPVGTRGTTGQTAPTGLPS